MPQIIGWSKISRYLWKFDKYGRRYAGKIEKRGYKDWAVYVINLETKKIVYYVDNIEKYTIAENILIKKMREISRRVGRS